MFPHDPVAIGRGSNYGIKIAILTQKNLLSGSGTWLFAVRTRLHRHHGAVCNGDASGDECDG